MRDAAGDLNDADRVERFLENKRLHQTRNRLVDAIAVSKLALLQSRMRTEQNRFDLDIRRLFPKQIHRRWLNTKSVRYVQDQKQNMRKKKTHRSEQACASHHSKHPPVLLFEFH
jgi:hypothetical protein